MPVKDRIVSWFIQHVVIPQREIIDKPGFIVTTFTEHDQITYLREIFLAERLFELIEKRIVERYDIQGKQVLYSAGKKFGYLYSSLSNFPTVKNCSNKQLSDFLYALVRYMEVTFSQQANHEINFEEKSFTISFEEYIVCRHNGLGYIMTDGGSAGIWAFLIQDKLIEATQLKCQGRGNEKCIVLCAPEKKIQEKTNNFFRETDLFELKFNEMYKALNEIQKTVYAQNSFRNLIDIGFIDCKEGSFSYKNMRLFGSESHILYLLEQEIAKLDGGEQVLFNACFEYGKLLQETYGYNDYKKFIPDFFSALGFGDILVTDSNGIQIVSVYYPWTTFSEQSKYTIFRGIMSGFVSGSMDKKIEFKKFDVNISAYLILTISE